MAAQNIPLTYKGHPLRRKDSLIYYAAWPRNISSYSRFSPRRRIRTWTWRPRFPFSFSSPTGSEEAGTGW
mgnify:CR=1 FL=1